MVNRIDGNNYYDYQQLKNVNIPDNGEKFSLDYKQGGLESESKDKKDKTEETANEQGQAAEKSGVKLEISSQGQSVASGRRRSDNDVSKAWDILGVQSIIGSVREAISTIVTAIKDFFYNLWYDAPRSEEHVQDSGESTDLNDSFESVNAAEVSASSSERAERNDLSDGLDAASNANIDARTAYRMNNEKLDRRIQPYLKSGDLNNVMNLLTDNGRKTIAINSNLLTYYDRNGKMVEPNASDRERILHGDIHTRKL